MMSKTESLLRCREMVLHHASQLITPKMIKNKVKWSTASKKMDNMVYIVGKRYSSIKAPICKSIS